MGTESAEVEASLLIHLNKKSTLYLLPLHTDFQLNYGENEVSPGGKDHSVPVVQTLRINLTLEFKYLTCLFSRQEKEFSNGTYKIFKYLQFAGR